MFSGIGGFRSGLEKVGGFKCVGYCEIDEYARRAYEALYDTKGEMCFENARTINPDMLPDVDVICGGFPCQSFSIAGNGEDLTISEEHFSLKLPELLPSKNLHFCSLKMFPDFYRMTKGGLLRQSSVHWTTSGMMSGGKCVTVQISECLNPEIACTLSDITERNVKAKYCLSTKQILKLLSGDCQAVKVEEYTPTKLSE